MHPTTYKFQLPGFKLALYLLASTSCVAGFSVGDQTDNARKGSDGSQPSLEATQSEGTDTAHIPAGVTQQPLTPASSDANKPTDANGTPPSLMGAILCEKTTGRRVNVSSPQALTAALADARAMDAIVLAPGVYEGNFVAQASGDANSPIALCGGPNTVLHGPSLTAGYTLYLQNAAWWQVVGLSVTGGAKGIMLDGAQHNLLKGLTVSGIGSEGIHLRRHSSDNLVDACTVSQTGLAGDPMFGEGIYIGSSKNNWCTLTAGDADHSDRNVIRNCTISQTTAENIDIKEGTTGGHIVGNHLNGLGIVASSASSLVNIKGNSYILENNTAQHAPADAFSVHVILAGWGACNALRGNKAEDTLTGYGVHMAASKPWPALLVASDNVFPLAQLGVSNAAIDGEPSSADACKPAIVSVACPG